MLLGVGWLYDRHFRPAYPDGPTVRIASWNLRQFNVRDATDFGLIARIIRDNDFDVVALQEVRGDGEAVDRLVDELNGLMGIGPWRAIVSNRTGNHQRFAFVYDADAVRYLGESGFLPSDLRISRRPYAAQFRSGNFDFSLVTVHLLYGDAPERRREARRLASRVNGVVLPAGTGERDVIVLGDFNTTRRRGGTMAPFRDNRWQPLIDQPTNLGDSRILDNLVIDPRHVAEWSGRAGVVRFDDQHFRDDDRAVRAVSDHRPIWADFVVTLEDDD
jgi:endonuclease/exonuclease/phosphatase family metal-dependent hydrolase